MTIVLNMDNAIPLASTLNCLERERLNLGDAIRQHEADGYVERFRVPWEIEKELHVKGFIVIDGPGYVFVVWDMNEFFGNARVWKVENGDLEKISENGEKCKLHQRIPKMSL